MLEDGRSQARRENFRSCERAAREWEHQRPHGLDEALAWAQQIRALFGDPTLDLRPWVGSDFRL